MKRSKRNKMVRTASLILLLVFVVFLEFKLIGQTGSSAKNFTLTLANPPKSSNIKSSNVKSKYHVVIDAGHGGKDPGAKGASGAYEKDLNLSLAEKVYELLEQDPSFDIQMTRTDDHFVELEDRAKVANDWNADALISIHGNTYTDSTVGGTETYYRHDDSIPLAEAIQEQMTKALGFPDRGVKEDHLKVLSLSKMPAILVEVGYLTNPQEEALLLSNKGQDLAAHAIVDGLKQYFNQHSSLPKNEQSDVPSTPSLQQGQRQIENKVYFNGSAKDGKQVALTFDDGPDSIVTPKILDLESIS